ncbi:MULTISPECIES: DUF938 domain-containing protein [Kordiimonas]|jgi:hypothetical protein|uniref:SAM-dependent methyltransferase n=1 Tax=Kordiimonas lacus TaxID=637679 RepID=A0A1G6T6H2_9PROT|nr:MULTISPECIES: DUF938 domain-containing protein [Kordiimonas]SDD24700.1 Protein of unknown function [Kordiimonas lacus]
MTRFFDPGQHEDETADARLRAAATARNRDVILAVLKTHLPERGSLLEVASGTGEHAAHMAGHFPNLHWQPTDIDPRHIASIDAWRIHVGQDNILPAKHLDVLEDRWPIDHLPAPLVAVMAVNLIHISPWEVTETLVAGAGETLGSGGVFYLYGPYKRFGAHTSESNEAFDASLKSRDPSWGVRDMESVVELAAEAGFGKPEVIPMPANNFSLVFKK